ncbi:LLM class flavin-dependent oxidoreductase, partial [Nocardia sp. NPDC060220]
MSQPRLFLGIETVGTGTHPASWRRTDSGAEDLFTAGYWTAVISSAEQLGFDAVFLPDAFGIQSGGAAVTRGRLDAVAIAARTAPLTSRIGLIPQVPVTHTEPFHASKAVTALDFASLGRAGWEVTVSTTEVEAKAFGRKQVQDPKSLWHEADEAIEVVTRLWDSWEDGAEI